MRMPQAVLRVTLGLNTCKWSLLVLAASLFLDVCRFDVLAMALLWPFWRMADISEPSEPCRGDEKDLCLAAWTCGHAKITSWLITKSRETCPTLDASSTTQSGSILLRTIKCCPIARWNAVLLLVACRSILVWGAHYLEHFGKSNGQSTKECSNLGNTNVWRFVFVFMFESEFAHVSFCATEVGSVRSQWPMWVDGKGLGLCHLVQLWCWWQQPMKLRFCRGIDGSLKNLRGVKNVVGIHIV